MKMIHWREVGEKEYHQYDGRDDVAMSRAKTADNHYFILINGGGVKEVLSDLLGGIK